MMNIENIETQKNFAEKCNVSLQVINNDIRRGKLTVVIVAGKKCILLDNKAISYLQKKQS